MDPETGQKVLAVRPYSKLRASLEKLREQALAAALLNLRSCRFRRAPASRASRASLRASTA